jgi:bla regulator protein BlaR1
MMAALTNHVWQSTVFAAVAGLFTIAFRHNRAHIRYSLWFAASLKFLVPFSVLEGLGSLCAWPSAAHATVPGTPDVSVVVARFAQPFSEMSSAAAMMPHAPVDWIPSILIVVWACGCVAVVGLRLRAWRRIRRAMRLSAPLTLPHVRPPLSVRTSALLLEPGVVGIWRPVLLLPMGIDDYLTADQLDAVLVHELCHVRRRDNLTAAIQMLVEAAAWFHPAVWWIGARLVDERERACDEDVLRRGGEPSVYAEAILNVCKLYLESPLTCVAGVTGSDLSRRVTAILTGRIGRDLNLPRRLALAVACGGALIAPVVVGMVTAPLRASAIRGTQASVDARPTFELASVKPCEPQPVSPGSRNGGGSGSFSPGRVYLSCFVVKNLISGAYVNQRAQKDPADGLDNWPLLIGGDPGGPQQVRGGPSWVYTDKYTIEATAPGLDPTSTRSPDRAVMQGPMLRALLEDRFRLRVHEAIEEVPMWALTVAKGGLKIKPMQPGGCSTDRSNGPINLNKAARLGVKPTCGTVEGGPDGPNWRWEHAGQTLAVVAGMLSSDLGVKVLDRTGVTDLFNITWEYGPDENTPGTLRWFATNPPDVAAPPTAASVFVALEQQLGLTLEKIKGPRGYIVIDHIERPTPNGEAPIGPARSRGAGG